MYPILQFLVKGTHYNDAIMSAMASQITSLTTVYPTVYSGADQRKHQSYASLAFVRGIHRWPVNSPNKGPVTRKMMTSLRITYLPHVIESSGPCSALCYGTTHGMHHHGTIDILVKGTHYNDAIMSAMASQITSLTTVYPTVYSGADQRKHQSYASLAFVRGIHRWPVNSPNKGPVTRKMMTSLRITYLPHVIESSGPCSALCYGTTHGMHHHGTIDILEGTPI